MRRAVPATMSALLLVGACSSGGGDVGVGGRFPIDQAAADAALLRLEDFPVGWVETPNELSDEPSDGSGVQWAECVGETGNGDLFDLGGVRASSGKFESGDGSSVEDTVTIADQEAVDDFIERFSDDECIRRIVETSMEDTEVSRLNLTAAGDELVAYRLTQTISDDASGTEIVVEVYIDLIVVQIDNAFTALEFYSARETVSGMEPFDASFVDRYVALAADRLDGKSTTGGSVSTSPAPLDACMEATKSVIETFDEVLDDIDMNGFDPETFDDVASGLTPSMTAVSRECGEERAGDALSALILHVDGRVTRATDMGQLFAEAMLDSYCSLDGDPVSLNPEARRVCQTRGGDSETTTNTVTVTTSTTTTTLAPTTTVAPALLTPEELQAAMDPVVAAWLATPSAATFDGLAAAAGVLVDSGRVGPVDRDPDSPRLESDALLTDAYLQRNELYLEGGGTTLVSLVDTAAETLLELREYPGSDIQVLTALGQLRLSVAVPVLISSGVYTVGVEIPPGTYVTENVRNCYWERLDANGEIIDNNFILAAPRAQVTIRSSDFAFNTEDCGTWRQQL